MRLLCWLLLCWGRRLLLCVQVIWSRFASIMTLTSFQSRCLSLSKECWPPTKPDPGASTACPYSSEHLPFGCNFVILHVIEPMLCKVFHWTGDLMSSKGQSVTVCRVLEQLVMVGYLGMVKAELGRKISNTFMEPLFQTLVQEQERLALLDLRVLNISPTISESVWPWLISSYLQSQFGKDP